MATIEARGYVNKLEAKVSGSGATRYQFDLAVQQKRKDKSGTQIVEKLYLRCVDFDGKEVPAEGEYVGVTGYLTVTSWAANGKNGTNLDVTVKSYEKLPQKERAAAAPAAKDAAPPSDPFALSPGKP
jgi:hypothetical protein